MKTIQYKQSCKKAGKGRYFFAAAALLVGALGCSLAMADPSTVTLGQIAHNVEVTVGSTARILQDIGIAGGIVLVLMGFMKFKQHSNNPQQIPITHAVIPLLIGASLIMYPMLITTATKAILGDTTNVTKLGGNEINTLIGSAQGS